MTETYLLNRWWFNLELYGDITSKHAGFESFDMSTNVGF